MNRAPAVRRRPDNARRSLEAAVERAIALLDALDGDPDLEAGCEDEGWDSDSEPEAGHAVPTYADDGHDGQNHLLMPSPYGFGPMAVGG